MTGVMLVHADSLHIPLADQCCQMICTSPPYWGLRSYGIGASQGELGGEAVHDCLGWAAGRGCGECYVCHLVAVGRELWRVLRNDGCLFLVLGDSYAKKQLSGVPWRVALALQADGWILRSEIIWAKPNPMPESVTDRPTKTHEQVFLLAKSPTYFYDAEAIKEAGHGGLDCYPASRGTLGHTGWARRTLETWTGRNSRSVWSLPTESYTGAHFATMPTALVERCIKAGTSERGCCPACGTPWVRTVQRLTGDVPSYNGSSFQRGKTHDARAPLAPVGQGERTVAVHTTGWESACQCEAGPPVPCLALDPFVGSGTVPLVARALGRHGVGLDLSYAYLHDQARARLQSPLLSRPMERPHLRSSAPVR